MMAKIACMPAYRDRAPKENPAARCCWVCGKLGGSGFTTALRASGYRMKDREMGYAHSDCMAKAMREASRHERVERVVNR